MHGGGPWRAPELKGTPLLDEFQSPVWPRTPIPARSSVAEAMGANWPAIVRRHADADEVETWTHSRDGADTRIDTAFVESPAEGGRRL